MLWHVFNTQNIFALILSIWKTAAKSEMCPVGMHFFGVFFFLQFFLLDPDWISNMDLDSQPCSFKFSLDLDLERENNLYGYTGISYKL